MQLKRPREEETCVVCYDGPACMLVRECGHKCMCVNCAFGVFMKQRTCPMCRAPILTAPLFGEDGKIRATFLAEAISAAAAHLANGCDPKRIQSSLESLVEYVPENTLRQLVRAHQLYSDRPIASTLELALRHPHHAELQLAAAAECTRFDPAVVAALASCSEPVANACLKLLDTTLRKRDAQLTREHVYPAIESARRRFPASAETQSLALLAATTAAKVWPPPSGFLSRALIEVHQCHGDVVRERLCHFFGTATLSHPEPMETWLEIVRVAAAVFSKTESAASCMRMMRFLTHAANVGQGTWNDIAETTDVIETTLSHATRLREQGVDKWVMAIADASLDHEKAARAFVESGGLEYLATAVETTLARDQSSIRKLARVVKKLGGMRGVSVGAIKRLAYAMQDAYRLCTRVESWTVAWDAAHVLKSQTVS